MISMIQYCNELINLNTKLLEKMNLTNQFNLVDKIKPNQIIIIELI